MTSMRAAVFEQKGEISIREVPESDQIADAYELFGHQRDGVRKVAIRP